VERDTIKQLIMKNLKDLEAQYKKLGKEIEKLKEQPQPPFWGWFKHYYDLHLIRVTSNGHNISFYDEANSALTGNTWGGYLSVNRLVRLATPDEIKEHLVRLMKEKYKHKDKVKSLIDDKVVKIDDKWTAIEYYSGDDDLYWNGICIYKQGKWAEIVPSLPTWEDLGVKYVRLSKVNTPIPTVDKYGNKVETLVRLLAVADYVNEGWEPDWEDINETKFRICYDTHEKRWFRSCSTCVVCSPAWFKSPEARDKAIEIFRHNGAEQELINFYK